MRRIEIKFNRKPDQTATIGLGLALLLLTLPLVWGALFGSGQFGTRLHARTEPSPAMARLTPAALAPTQRLTTSDQTPQGQTPQRLVPSDWASIRAAYEQGRHRAFPVAGGHQARNPRQQWRTHFDGRGFAVEPDAGAWRWGLELRGYGFDRQTRDLTGKARVTTAGERVTYAWDETVEE